MQRKGLFVYTSIPINFHVFRISVKQAPNAYSSQGPSTQVVGAAYQVSSSISKCVVRASRELHAQHTYKNDPPARNRFFHHTSSTLMPMARRQAGTSCCTARGIIYLNITEFARVRFVGREMARSRRSPGSCVGERTTQPKRPNSQERAFHIYFFRTREQLCCPHTRW